MKLRELQAKDAPLMLEWMHDELVVQHMQNDFSNKTLEDCLCFIAQSNEKRDLHFAIADEEDTYMGTVSLKNIENNAAEFAITVRSTAMGKGYAKWAMQEILRHGFEEFGLAYIYWYVSTENSRAVNFYNKNHYPRSSAEEIRILLSRVVENRQYFWYLVRAEDII